MKVIFLDIDGVLDTLDSGWKLDSVLIQRLKDVVEETDAKIVLSSSWKIGCKDAEDFRKKMNHPPYLIDYRNELVMWLIDNVDDVTDNRGPARGNEIQRWIYNHKADIESYVILDDDSDMLDHQLFNFVQTDTYEGLTEREKKLAVCVLENKKIHNPIRLNLELITRWRNKNKRLTEDNITKLLEDYYKRFDDDQ